MVFAFTTVETAPAVTSVTPANGATGVPSNTNLTITFSELVDIPSAAFSVECPAGLPQGFTVVTPATLPTSTSTVVITPASNLPDATTCTVTVFGAQVSDTDTIDPPDTMAADFTFTTEGPPSVAATTPTAGATGVNAGDNIVIIFDEPVNVTAASFNLECPVATLFRAGSPCRGPEHLPSRSTQRAACRQV